LFGQTPIKAQNNYIFQKFGGAMAPFAPPGYAYELGCIFLFPTAIANGRHNFLLSNPTTENFSGD